MKSIFSQLVYLIVIIMISISLLGGVSTDMIANTGNLPKKVGVWTKADSVRIIDSTNIFDYMNGAGELYLAYRFDHLEVYEYTAEGQDNIFVEVYVMKTSNDAFGLLSMDWSGNPVSFTSLSKSDSTISSIAPPIKALYYGGLLCLWSDTLYVRVSAVHETTESKEAVLALGQVFIKNLKISAEPELLKILPQAIDAKWTLRNDYIRYLRSNLVLNSFYYLSHQNILNLNLSTEAVIAPYKNITGNLKQIQLLFIKYATINKAKKALKQFNKIYLPEHKLKSSTVFIKNKHFDFFKIEDGWLGYRLEEKYLTIVFECPTRDNAEMILEHISNNIINLED